MISVETSALAHNGAGGEKIGQSNSVAELRRRFEQTSRAPPSQGQSASTQQEVRSSDRAVRVPLGRRFQAQSAQASHEQKAEVLRKLAEAIQTGEAAFLNRRSNRIALHSAIQSGEAAGLAPHELRAARSALHLVDQQTETRILMRGALKTRTEQALSEAISKAEAVGLRPYEYSSARAVMAKVCERKDALIRMLAGALHSRQIARLERAILESEAFGLTHVQLDNTRVVLAEAFEERRRLHELERLTCAICFSDDTFAHTMPCCGGKSIVSSMTCCDECIMQIYNDECPRCPFCRTGLT